MTEKDITRDILLSVIIIPTAILKNLYASSIPKPFMACAKFFEGDVKGSLDLQLKAIPLIEKLFCEVNPIPVKKAMELMGKDCGPLRMPLTELSPEHTQKHWHRP